MRLIDADALEKRFKLRINWLKKDVHNQYSLGLYHGCETDVKLIDEMSTIEAEPVKHGRWETNSDRPDSLICSICKCGFDMWKHDPHNYCPNCGAKMDGDRKEGADNGLL